MRFAALAVLAALVMVPAAQAADSTTRHGLSIHGELKYPANFTHFDYVNPDAPKGGTVRYSAIGTFDTLNPYVIRGVAGPIVFDTLTAPAQDEASVAYGLIAESFEIPADHTSVTFHLRREAKFQDGSPITPEDVIWTLQMLREKGKPFYRNYYGDVTKAEKIGDHSVKFSFKSSDNAELPLILGQLPVLSKAYWNGKDFEATTLEAPLRSGPYKVESLEPGRSITFRRDPNYWGQNLPVNKGRNNFDVIRYDYYRDSNVALEAFKADQYDIRRENSSKNWSTGYDSPALKAGLFKMEAIPNEVPTGMQAFGFNLRNELFKDPKVRQALAYAFDFEWSNKNLFYGMYSRTKSYFSNSELASQGLPSVDELAVLEKYKDRLPPEVFSKTYEPPKTDATGNIRDNLREGLRLLKEAGWTVKGKNLVNDKTGKPFTFEILLYEPVFERIALPFKQNLERLGITMNIRTVDIAQYQKRMDDRDFEMAIVSFPQSDSPGNEQRDYWSSAAAKDPASRNELGIADPVIDELIELLIQSPDHKTLVTRVRALDRVLLWGFYTIPQWHYSKFNVAAWERFGRPAKAPKYEVGLDTWWWDQKKADATAKREPQVVK